MHKNGGSAIKSACFKQELLSGATFFSTTCNAILGEGRRAAGSLEANEEQSGRSVCLGSYHRASAAVSLGCGNSNSCLGKTNNLISCYHRNSEIAQPAKAVWLL